MQDWIGSADRKPMRANSILVAVCDDHQQLVEELLKRNEELEDENTVVKERLRVRDEEVAELEKKLERCNEWIRELRASAEQLELELGGDGKVEIQG